MLTKSAILDAKDLAVKNIPVPEWGGEVGVRILTGAERDDFDSACANARRVGGRVDTRGLKIKLVSLGICDEKGERLFDEKDIKDLQRKSGKALDRVFTAVQKHNGMSAEEVEDLKGNSDADLSD